MFNSICSAPRLQMCWRANFPTRIFHLSARSKDSDCAIRRLSAWIYKDTPGDLWKGQMYEIMHASVQYIYNYISVSSIINRIIQERMGRSSLLSLWKARRANIKRKRAQQHFCMRALRFCHDWPVTWQKVRFEMRSKFTGYSKTTILGIHMSIFKSQLHYSKPFVEIIWKNK